MVILWRSGTYYWSGHCESDYGDNFHREGLSGEELKEEPVAPLPEKELCEYEKL